MLSKEDSDLCFGFDSEEVRISPWGPNALRIRATKQHEFPNQDWALDSPPAHSSVTIEIHEDHATIANGSILASITRWGKITIFDSSGQRLLEEYTRTRANPRDPKASTLMVESREFKPLPGGDYHLTYRLESVDRGERIYGMGQYQQPQLNLKGLDLELAQRNSQASVPFMVSSLGYGLLWNQPAIGRAFLGQNIMSFEAQSTKVLDYWIVAGDSPAAIVEAYSNVTGKTPMMPEYGLGFWQSKLRYQTQDELLQVAREYRKRELPIDVIVLDYFHWTKQGTWNFDPTYWPDPGTCFQSPQIYQEWNFATFSKGIDF